MIVRENLEFERGRDPKRSLGLGGVDPFGNFKKEFRELWHETLAEFDSMVGKTITAEMEKYWMDERHHPQYDYGEYTIKVERIYNSNIEITNENEQNIRPMIIFVPEGDDINRYKYKGDSKINIEG